MTFGKLTVLERAGTLGTNPVWKCRCACGMEVLARANNLSSGATESCGCIHLERSTKHGRCKARVYNIWHCMLQRCLNPKAPNYHRYGGRGIQVCARWRSFEAFYEDMGDPPSDDHTLDRIDNDGAYEQGNCHWATGDEQHSNKSSNRNLTHEGVTMTAAQWARSVGLPKVTLLGRLNSGWSVEQALTTPRRPRKEALK